jgi:bacteriorhodopsin
MIMSVSVSAPWTVALSTPQHIIVLYFLVVAALALFAGLVRSVLTRNESGSRYRAAVTARLAIAAIAFLSYVVIIIEFARGYTLRGTTWYPNSETILTMAPRYMDWSVTVPLLTVELLAVCTVVGVTARRTQLLAGGGAFLMIFFGFIGAFVIDGGASASSLLLLGGISSIFWIFTNVVLIRSVRASIPQLTPEAGRLLRSATILLLSGWVVYPIVYLLQIFTTGGFWISAMQIVLCVADVVVKIGFGGLIHRVAKLRTAEDVRAGDDVHPESIWMSSVKLSDAGQPREVYLADGAAVHPTRAKPPVNEAVAAQPLPDDSLDV